MRQRTWLDHGEDSVEHRWGDGRVPSLTRGIDGPSVCLSERM